MNQIFSSFPLLMGAPAEGASASGSGQILSMLIMFVPIILIFYFLIARPQKKERQRMQNMLAALKKGDKVVTTAGIRGVVQSVKEDTVIVKVDDNTKIEFTKAAIAAVTETAVEEKSGE